ANVDTVIGFYNYLLLHDDLENTLSEKLVKFVRTPGKGYRSFLYGIADNKAQVQAQVGGETSYAKRVAGLVKHRYSAILSSGSIPMSYLSTPKPRKWGRIHKTEEKGNNTIIWYCKNIYCTNSCIFLIKYQKMI
ncbi:MAG: hypothetical protein IJN92_00005, partial [Lachnospiraceae bacterium]|nr:hypothetical protein [Lachnospiraceae bacterium]